MGSLGNSTGNGSVYVTMFFMIALSGFINIGLLFCLCLNTAYFAGKDSKEFLNPNIFKKAMGCIVRICFLPINLMSYIMLILMLILFVILYQGSCAGSVYTNTKTGEMIIGGV